ncbi:MAG TPA: NUDIX hydrolase [Candidatus Thermoplasmatota archaeon]|nr:NUDIX hydrolase [Candidatus Thermoplasmatota archaeon]
MERDPVRPEYLYVECDGMVYLVEREGRLAFPTADEVPFPVARKVEIGFEDATVHYCIPEVDDYPVHWTHKDLVPALTNVDPLVQRAINASLVREVTGALVLREGPTGREVLLVKASRGFTKGLWNMPGGFVNYGETLEAGVVREVKEEVGIDIRLVRSLGVYTKRFTSPYFMRCHVFEAVALSEDLDLDPTEIAEARWWPLHMAAEVTRNPFALGGIEVLVGKRSVL